MSDSMILDWLDRLAETAADPVAAAKIQGLPENGNVMLDLRLHIDEPPQVASLERWVDGRIPGERGPSYNR